LPLGWKVVGSAIAMLSTMAAHSVALAWFGLDSLIEIFASLIVVWQLRGEIQNRERQALRLIGLAFFALALYVLVQSCYSLLTQARPDTSVVGIAWLAATLVAMLLLAWGKGR